MGRRGMPKRRFFYDKEGNLTGSSSDIRLPGGKAYRVFSWIVIVYVVSSLFLNKGTNPSQRPASLENATGERLYSAKRNTNVRARPSTKDSEVVGTVDAGESLRAIALGERPRAQWLQLASGPYQAKFVWAANFAPADPVSSAGQEHPPEQRAQSGAPLAR